MLAMNEHVASDLALGSLVLGSLGSHKCIIILPFNSELLAPGPDLTGRPPLAHGVLIT